METELEIRSKMKKNIFTILTNHIDRDNKNQYCNDHATERAKIIEASLYKNCCKINSDFEKIKEIYENINAEELINGIEEKTTKCLYKR